MSEDLLVTPCTPAQRIALRIWWEQLLAGTGPAWCKRFGGKPTADEIIEMVGCAEFDVKELMDAAPAALTAMLQLYRLKVDQDFKSADWFRAKTSVPLDRLRKAGLRTTSFCVRKLKIGKNNYYSVADAKRLWSDRFPDA